MGDLLIKYYICYFRLHNPEILKELDNLKKSYFELGQVFEILNNHYAIPIFIQVTNMFFDLLLNSYLIATTIMKKWNVEKSNAFLMTYSELMLICYSKVNFSSEGNFVEYKREFSSSIDVPFNNRTLTDVNREFIFDFLEIFSVMNIIYETVKLILLIFSMEKLAKYKYTTYNILKR